MSRRAARGLSRRRFLEAASLSALLAPASPAWAGAFVDLDLPGGPSERSVTTDFPQKGRMILQRSRPPLLETPFDAFDRGVFTPNDQFFVRWHWSGIPTAVDVAAFRLTVRGEVNQTLSLSMADLLAMPRVELAAVNQCSGNSRGLFQPRVPGGQWGNGAMSNARWTGVRLRDLLDRAGVKASAVAVRFKGLDEPPVDNAPTFMKSLDIDHARDGEVMLAYLMNGEQLPLLNGFPLRAIVPGWYSTYWVKMLNDIEILSAPDDNYLDEDGLPYSRYPSCERQARRKGVCDSADQPDGAALLLHQSDRWRVGQAGRAGLGARDRVRRRLRRRQGRTVGRRGRELAGDDARPRRRRLWLSPAGARRRPRRRRGR